MRNSACLSIIFVLILILIVFVKADIRRDCRRQTRVPWASLKKLKAGNFNQDDITTKCYMRCFMLKSGIVSYDNKVDERVLRHLPRRMQESSRRIVRKCQASIDPLDTDHCDVAFQIAKCYVNHHPEIVRSVPFV